MSYFKNHPGYTNSQNKDSLSENKINQFDKEISYFLWTNKDAQILEIWFWSWIFAKYCKSKGFINYTWIDIDDYFIKNLKEKCLGYDFFISSIEDFLKERENNFDIIYMSNVFEHLDKNQRESCINLLNKSLKEHWLWINYMPNADAILWVGTGRYTDITHFTIYNSNSFEQLLNGSTFSEIKHLNQQIWNTLFKKYIHNFFLFLTRIYFLSMWFTFPSIYTGQILSIIKK